MALRMACATALLLALPCSSTPVSEAVGATFKELLELRKDPTFPRNINDGLRVDDFHMFSLQQNIHFYTVWPPQMSAQFVVPPSVSGPLPSRPAGFLTDLFLPAFDETWPVLTDEEVNLTRSVAAETSFPHGGWLCGEWVEGEDPKATIDALVGSATNPDRVLVPFGPERFTDEGLSIAIFKDFGQHRVEKVRTGDVHAAGATYAVYLGFAEDLKVRPGFARYGADAYFDAEGEVMHIRRLGKTYYPSQPGWAKHTLVNVTLSECHEVGGWHRCWSLSRGMHPCECSVPAKVGYLHARMAFLGTLVFTTVSVDHLLWTHLSVSNALVTANVQELGINHPLRRLMHPHTFRTAQINYGAGLGFFAEYSTVERISAVTRDSLKDFWANGAASDRNVKFLTPPQQFAAQGFTPEDKVQLPLHQDGTEFFAVLKEHVHNFTSAHYDYASNACGADEAVQRWVSRASSLLPHQELPTGDALTCETLEDILATFIYMVTAHHVHVGQLHNVVNNPCQGPGAWREGELCGTPRTSLMSRLVADLTGLPQPLLMDDYTHLFLGEADKQQWRHFQEGLRRFNERLAVRNEEERPRPFRSFDLDVVEVAVGI